MGGWVGEGGVIKRIALEASVLCAKWLKEGQLAYLVMLLQFEVSKRYYIVGTGEQKIGNNLPLQFR